MKYKWNLISGDQVLDSIWTDNNDPEEAMEVFMTELSLGRILTSETRDQVYVTLVDRYPVALEYYQTIVDTQKDPEILKREMQDLINETQEAFEDIFRDVRVIAKALDQMERQGSEIDFPEGTRFIQISDNLANAITKTLKEFVNV